MFKLDPDKNWVICLLIGAFVCVLVFTFWPYIVAAVIVVALVKGFSTPWHHSN
jgi:hypothetical protein